MPTIRDWITKAINVKWPPEAFWEAMGEAFEIKGGYTEYESIMIVLEQLDSLESNLKDIQAVLPNLTYAEAETYVRDRTGLIIHPNLLESHDVDGKVIPQSGNEGAGKMLENYIDTIKAGFNIAQKKGKIESFFKKAFGKSLCVPDRFMQVQNYLEIESTENAVPKNFFKYLEECAGDFYTKTRSDSAKEFKTYMLDKKEDYKDLQGYYQSLTTDDILAGKDEGVYKGDVGPMTEQDIDAFIAYYVEVGLLEE